MPWWIVVGIILALVLVGLVFLLKPSSPSQTFPDKTGLFNNVQPFLTNFDSVVGLRQRTDRYYYAWDQTGRVWRIDVQTGQRTLVLDKSNDVAKVYDGPFNFGGDERGLLGLAFNPSDSNEVFVAYSAPKADPSDAKTNHVARLSRFTIEDKDGPGERFIDEQIVLHIPQQEAYHHAQSLEFNANDNMLYYSVGDGGPQGDPLGHAQNPFELRGKILRLDVNKKSDGKQYSIPSTNPFADGKKGAPEVIALGLRNPWRFSLERGNRLFIADVGNNSQESIKILQLPSSATEPLKPVNFGWAVYEGDEKTNNEGNSTLSTEPWTKPAFTYKTGGSLGRAVVGGFLLPPGGGGEGKREKERYLFADYVSGNLVVIEQPEKEGEKWKLVSVTPPEKWFPSSSHGKTPAAVPAQQPVSQQFADAKKNISALARDVQGNIYVLVWTQASAGDGRTAIYRL